MPIWSQFYDPLGNIFFSAIVAAIPACLLLVMIAGFNFRIHLAALIALGACLALAVGLYHMPVAYAVASAAYGAGNGLFPIGWIVLNIIFVYQLTVQRGLFDVLRRSLARVAPDPRIQVILIAFAFGSFLEGMSGFGAPVAITAAIMIQLGFPPLQACGLALVANTAPVAFGSVGIPITTLQQVTDLDTAIDGQVAALGQQQQTATDQIVTQSISNQNDQQMKAQAANQSADHELNVSLQNFMQWEGQISSDRTDFQ